MLIEDTGASSSHEIEIVGRSFLERPPGLSIDRPLLQLKDTPELGMRYFSESLSLPISKYDDGLAEDGVDSILFESKNRNMWFHVYSDPALGGVVISTHADSDIEMFHNFVEFAEITELDGNQCSWISEDIMKGMEEYKRQYEHEHEIAEQALHLDMHA